MTGISAYAENHRGSAADGRMYGKRMVGKREAEKEFG